MSNVQTVLLESARDPSSSGYVPGFTGSGFVSLATLYASFALCNWAAPSIVAVAGPRITMFLGSLLYALFIGQFWQPNTIILYLCSAILGLGAAILWTAQVT